MQETLTHDATTPLVAQDVAQGRGILNDALAIIKARIRTRA